MATKRLTGALISAIHVSGVRPRGWGRGWFCVACVAHKCVILSPFLGPCRGGGGGGGRSLPPWPPC